MDIQEKNEINRKKADKEWQEIVSEHARRFDERCAELQKNGIRCSLDGENYFEDIDIWFNEELEKFKKKYSA